MYSEIISYNYHVAHNISHVVSENFLIHSHDFYELYYFLSGDMRLIYAGTEYELKPHTLVIVAPNVFHGLRVLSTAPYDRHTLHFTEDLLPESCRDLLMSGLPTEETLRAKAGSIPYLIENADQLGLLTLMEAFQKLLSVSDALRDCLASTLTQLILGKLHAAVPVQGFSAPDRARQKASPEMESILNYINENLTRKLSLDILSDQFFISKSKLNALFHKRMNMTAMEYITRRRLNYAQQLLINGFSAAQTAAAAGFGDYTGFYRAYSKHMGHSPAKDMRCASPLPSVRQLFYDEADLSTVQHSSRSSELTIWDVNRSLSVSEIDIAVIRDTWEKAQQKKAD